MHQSQTLLPSKESMWGFFVTCLIASATCFQRAESQRSFGYDQRLYRPRPLLIFPNNGPFRIGTNDRTDQSSFLQPAKSGEKVRLDIYYETDCPDSMRFITRQLYPLYRDMKEILDIHLVPYGKATENYDSISKKYQFSCHHGPAECYGNTVQSCAISLYPKTDDHLELINCMEAYPRPSDNGQKCARRLSMDWKKISKCVDGDEGNRLLHENAERTTSLNPKLYFVPWINVNNVHSDSIQRRSLRNLKGVICDSYQGRHQQCSY